MNDRRGHGHRPGWRALLAALLLLSAVTAVAATLEQAQLDKLQLEIAALQRAAQVPVWLSPLGGLAVGLLVGLLSAGGAWHAAYRGRISTLELAQRSRLGELDQAVHEKRIEVYARLAEATEPLALYFPPQAQLGPSHCAAMGEALRSWYFQHGGLLMTVDSRDAYFALARALTLGAGAESLAAPVFPTDAAQVSKELVDAYRQALAPLRLRDVEAWRFGPVADADASTAKRFKDFVFLQTLSSDLRTALSKDVHGRRPPAGAQHQP